MTKILSSTLRRLQKLKRTNSIWEGDRRVLPKNTESRDGSNLIHIGQYLSEIADNTQPHCILWVDGSLGMVRSMEVVKPNIGQEAIVRSLLQAIERPQSSAQPYLPQKILVRDRSIQFYLRGILQDLDISVEYVESLPLIDDIFSNILEQGSSSPPAVPQEQAAALYAQTRKLWQLAPWAYLMDYQVLAIEINYLDIESLYAVVMGKLGLEKGVVMYRTPFSLVEFRRQVTAEDEDEDDEDDNLEEVFLRQDCFFTLFEDTEALAEADVRNLRASGWSLVDDGIYPVFGSVNPLEGGRSFLDIEEATVITIALSALNTFLEQHKRTLKSKKFGELSHATKLAIADQTGTEITIDVAVRTLLDLSTEVHDAAQPQPSHKLPTIHEHLWHDKSLFQLLGVPWQLVEILRALAPHSFFDPKAAAPEGEALSGLLIQTSRPKALELIQEIEDLGGISSICFNPAEDPDGNALELGLLIMGNGELHLFNLFADEKLKSNHPVQKWKQRAKQNKGRCAIMIAMGVTGSTRGKPSPQQILGYYEVQLVTPKELGLGKLKAEQLQEMGLDS